MMKKSSEMFIRDHASKEAIDMVEIEMYIFVMKLLGLFDNPDTF